MKFSCPLIHIPTNRNAVEKSDKLEWIEVENQSVVLNKEEFKDEHIGVYVPIDASASKSHPLLGFLDGSPVKLRKLRGVNSYGLVIPWSKVRAFLVETGFSEQSIEKVCVLGKDFGPILKIKKHRDENRLQAGNSTNLTTMMKYTDIEPYHKHCLMTSTLDGEIKRISTVFDHHETVNVTEKVHGTSARYRITRNGSVSIGSSNRELIVTETSDSVWLDVYHNQMAEILKRLRSDLLTRLGADEIVVYGEIIGPKVQDLTYGLDRPRFFAYDIIVDGCWVAVDVFYEICKAFSIDVVPIIHAYVPFTEELLEERNGKTLMNATHTREGIVIKPVNPRYDPTIGRVIVKVVGEDYHNRKNPLDRVAEGVV